MLGEIWDYILDGIEWLKDAISDTFTGLGEFSKYGLGFGLCGVLFLLFTDKWMLAPFLSYMKPASKVITLVLTYIGTFGACYLLGNRMENN